MLHQRLPLLLSESICKTQISRLQQHVICVLTYLFKRQMDRGNPDPLVYSLNAFSGRSLVLIFRDDVRNPSTWNIPAALQDLQWCKLDLGAGTETLAQRI